MNNVNTTKGGVDLSIDCPNCRLKVPISDIQRMKNGVHVNYVLSSIVETILQLKTSFKVSDQTTATIALQAPNWGQAHKDAVGLKMVVSTLSFQKKP